MHRVIPQTINNLVLKGDTMSTSTIVWIGISMVFMLFMGMLIGYTLGHEDGHREGFHTGKLHE
jgi:hypothetical protein